jgi:hypothetical protein
MTGTGKPTARNTPAAYNARRNAVSAPNSSDAGHSTHASQPRRSQARVKTDSSVVG